MSTIISCDCGAKLRLPAGSAATALRCPQCKSVVSIGALPATSNPLATANSFAVESEARICPICQSSIGAGDELRTCGTCSQAHHAECWSEMGGCSTYGCREAPAPEKESASAQPLTAWGDTKACPICGESIKSIALKCRYCGTTFDTVDPLSIRDLHRKDKSAETQKKLTTTVVALFAITLLVGCAAPLMAIINPIYILPRRQKLAAAGPFYLVLGYSAMALAVLYSILMLVLYLFGGGG